MLAGTSGIDLIAEDWAGELPVRIAAQLKRFAAAVAKQALQAERLTRRHAFGFMFHRGNRCSLRIRRLRGIRRFL